VKRTIAYGTLGGVLIVLLKVIEYKHLVRAYPTEIYVAIVAILFAAVGLYLGVKWSRPPKVVVREVVRREGGPFVRNEAAVAELAITPRELEILGLIAIGMSNREIADKLFVSENTVKTHSSRLFQKLSASRRTQAAQRGRELGLIP